MASTVVKPSVSLSAPLTAETGVAFALSGTGYPARGGRSVVMQRLSGRSWVPVGSTQQASNGRYSLSTSLTGVGRFSYRAMAVAWLGAAPVYSVPRVVSVHRPYILMSPSTAIAAETVKVTGTLPGVLNSRPVWVQRLSGKTWMTVVKATTSKTGSYATATGFRAPGVGSYAVRSLAPRVIVGGKVRAQYVCAAKTLKVVAQSASLSMPATLVEATTGTATVKLTPVRVMRVVALQVLKAGVWTGVGVTGRQSSAGTVPFPITAGPPGSYSYRAYTASAAGAAAFVSLPKPLVVIPPPVTGVIATPATTSITLSWTNPTAVSVTGVMIRRAPGAVPPASATAGDRVADVAKPAFSVTDVGLVAGTPYSYALFAHDGTLLYAAGATVTSTTIAILGPVTGVVATPASISITLSWTNPVSASLTGVVIRGAPGPTPPASVTDGVPIADLDAPESTFTDTGLTPGTQYSYALFAHDGTSGYSAGAPITMTTVAPGEISGTVTDAAGAQSGLENVSVSVTTGSSGNEGPPGTHGNDVTDANGSYTVTGLAAGADYTVCFSASTATTGGSSDVLGYVDECYDNEPITGETPTLVTVTSGLTTLEIDAGLVGGGAVSGTVRDAGGTHQGLEHVDVTVVSEATGSNGTAVTDDAGGYRVTGLAGGEDYTVCFETSRATGGSSETGYVDECYDNQPSLGAPTSVHVTLGETTVGINADLDGGGAISGTVVDFAGNHPPLTGVQVLVDSLTGSSRTVTTASDGSYTVLGLEGGEDYTVCFNGSNATGGTSFFGYVEQCYLNASALERPTPVTVNAGATTRWIDAELRPRSEVHT